MASKFQNRLVGTVVLVALSVIILPSLLDGKKKQYEDKFAAIPLVPQMGDVHESDLIPPAGQSLPLSPPEGAKILVEQQVATEAAAQQAAHKNVQQRQTPAVGATSAPAQSQVKPKSVIKAETEEKAPVGKAYVVQLGALKNAVKANEIVANLRLSGYRAYTVPATPVQGELTRIYVGPNVSKQKLQEALPALNTLTGLDGQVKTYSLP